MVHKKVRVRLFFFTGFHPQKSTKVLTSIHKWLQVSKPKKDYSPSCRAMQMMNKVRDLHMKEAIIIIPCLMFWCVKAAAVSWHTSRGVDEWGWRAATGALCSCSCKDICLYSPHGWFHEGPSYLCVLASLCRTVLLHNTHILHLPSSHSNCDLNIQYCQRPHKAKKGIGWTCNGSTENFRS